MGVKGNCAEEQVVKQEQPVQVHQDLHPPTFSDSVSSQVMVPSVLYLSTWIVMLEKPNSERRSFVAFMRTICESATSSEETNDISFKGLE